MPDLHTDLFLCLSTSYQQDVADLQGSILPSSSRKHLLLRYEATRNRIPEVLSVQEMEVLQKKA